MSGVSKVLFAEDHAYCHGMAESTAALVVGLAGGYSHICGAATAFNKNVLPRVAALLDVMVISDATNVVDADTFERPIYAGNAIQTVKSSDGKKVVSIRTSTFDPAGRAGQNNLGHPGLHILGQARVGILDRCAWSSYFQSIYGCLGRTRKVAVCNTEGGCCARFLRE